MRERGGQVHTGRKVVAVEPGAVVAADGARIALDDILWVTPAGAAPWLAETGPALDERGFVEVRDTLESTSHPGVFAAGDVAGVPPHPPPNAGVFPARPGTPLADTLRRALVGRHLRPLAPQQDRLYPH